MFLRIDVEVPGDGSTVRGAYLDWMASSEVAHPLHAETRDLIPEPFAGNMPLHMHGHRHRTVWNGDRARSPTKHSRSGPSVQKCGVVPIWDGIATTAGACSRSKLRVPKVDAPPEIYLNGENLGPVTLVLPDLADPGYRGEMRSLVRQMQFQYTGWLRAQKLLPVSRLKVGTNDLIIVAETGPDTPPSAPRRFN